MLDSFGVSVAKLSDETRASILELTGSDLSLADVLEVARRRTRICLDTGARQAVDSSRELKRAMIASEMPIYGVTTGFGDSAHRQISPARVIVGYSARIDPRALGEGIEALIEVYCADRTAPTDVGRSLAGLEGVISAFTVSGEADAVVRARLSCIAELESFVERLRRDPNVVRTKTLLVLSTLIDRPT
jgi:Aromatic amino acid lyase/Lrp/AsnC ligand binding domain